MSLICGAKHSEFYVGCSENTDLLHYRLLKNLVEFHSRTETGESIVNNYAERAVRSICLSTSISPSPHSLSPLCAPLTLNTH